MKLVKFCFVFLLVFSKYSLALVLTGNESLVFTGSEEYVDVLDSSSISIQDMSEIYCLNAADNSTVNVLGGDIECFFARNNALTNISGGNIGWLNLYGNTITNIESPSSLQWLFVNDNSVVNIFGSNFNYAQHQLSGNWVNGKAFSFWAIGDNGVTPFDDPLPDNIVLHNVPEPLPIALMVIGLAGIFYRRKFANNHAKS